MGRHDDAQTRERHLAILQEELEKAREWAANTFGKTQGYVESGSQPECMLCTVVDAWIDAKTGLCLGCSIVRHQNIKRAEKRAGQFIQIKPVVKWHAGYYAKDVWTQDEDYSYWYRQQIGNRCEQCGGDDIPGSNAWHLLASYKVKQRHPEEQHQDNLGWYHQWCFDSIMQRRRLTGYLQKKLDYIGENPYIGSTDRGRVKRRDL